MNKKILLRRRLAVVATIFCIAFLGFTSESVQGLISHTARILVSYDIPDFVAIALAKIGYFLMAILTLVFVLRNPVEIFWYSPVATRK